MCDDFKVVPLKPRQNSDAVEVLESVMKQVKSGKIRAIAISWVRPDGTIGGDISHGDNNFFMVASVRNMMRYIEKLTFDGD